MHREQRQLDFTEEEGDVFAVPTRSRREQRVAQRRLRVARVERDLAGVLVPLDIAGS
jgi:hypothetical protein